MKIIGPDGSIEGWFVALLTTGVVYGMLIAAFVGGEELQAAYINIGGYVNTVYPLSFGSWLAYKTVKAVADKK